MDSLRRIGWTRGVYIFVVPLKRLFSLVGCTYIADAKHVMIECIVYKQRLYMWETGKIGRGYLRVNLSLA
jgi:hypothetical protein